jgi:hypothetical protein
MNFQAIVAVIFGLLLIGFMTLGSVLVVYFAASRLSMSTRALLAAALSALVMLGPAFIIGGYEAGASFVAFAAAAAFLIVMALPIAYLGTRKLDRRLREFEPDIASVFE